MGGKKRAEKHPVKAAIAERLRRETTVSLKWIAESHSMRS